MKQKKTGFPGIYPQQKAVSGVFGKYVSSRPLLFMIMLFHLTGIAYSQSNSPNASSTAQSASALVGPYTGKPDISIPIVSVSGRSINIPVGLSYTSTGVLVEDVGSWVGLGWDLSAAGAITRSVRGLDDFTASNKGYIQPNVSLPQNIDGNCDDGATDYSSYLNDVIDLERDAEPDLFSLSVPGFSAQFVFDQQGNPYTIPLQKIEITEPNSGGDQWTVKSADGYVYHFGGTGYTEVSDGVVTSWLLKQIVTPVGELVDFTYNSATQEYDLLPSETHVFTMATSGCSAGDAVYTDDRNISVASKLLSTISVNDFELEFINAPRCDISGGKKLDKILYKYNGATMKEFLFDYSCDSEKQRFWLTGFREKGSGGNTLPPYRFEYYQKDALPGIRSYAQDHWGYYNGEDSNIKLTSSYLSVPDNFVFSGANRTPDADKVRYGTLSKITYPTGGYTEYDFEPNDYGNYTEQYPELVESPQVAEVGMGNRTTIISSNNGSSAEINFTLLQTTTVQFEYIVDDMGQSPTGDHSVKLKQGSTTIFTTSNSGSRSLLLNSGTYTIVASIGSSDPDIFLSEITAYYNTLTGESSTPSSRQGGGIRIAEIRTYHSDDPTDKTVYQYDYSTFGSTSSSGKLMSGPAYHYDIREYCTSSTYIDQKVFASSSNIPLSTSAAGSYVGYTNVTVSYSSANDQGKTEYTFVNSADAFVEDSTPFGNQKVPYVPTQGDWYKNGSPLKQTNYRYYSGNTYKISETENTYAYVGSTSVNGLVVVNSSLPTGQCTGLFHGLYQTSTAWVQATQTTQKSFDGYGAQTGNTIQTEANYTYDTSDPWLLEKQSTVNSEGTELISRYRYPSDFDAATSGGVIGQMQTAHLLSPVLETINYRKEGSTETVTGGSVTEYSNINGHFLPTSVYALETEAPLSSITQQSNNLVADSHFKLQATSTYDNDGNLTSTSSEGMTSAIIRGYADDIALARVNNASASQVAYSGFESTDHGNWSYSEGGVGTSVAYTGARSFAGTLTATVPSGDYVVSLWANGSGSVTVNGDSKAVNSSWSYYEWKLTGATSISVASGSIAIDEVRLYPANAQMTNFTYERGVGIASVSGADGRPVLMEYDEWNRQVLARDHNGDIIEIKEYNLGQVLYGEITAATPQLNQSSSWSVNVPSHLSGGVTYTWDFGDGTAAQNGQSVNHTYTSLGVFEVQVTLAKAGYETVTERKVITVGGQLAGTISHTTPNPDVVVTYTANGTSVNPPGTSYTWTFSDIVGSKTGTEVDHVHGQLGRILVELTIEHDDYPTVVNSQYVTINGSMVADWTPPSGNDLKEDESFNFVALNHSNNPTDATYTWTFGDGSSTTGKSVNHAYTTANTTVTAKLEVTHPNYTTQSESYNIDIEYDNPTLSLVTPPGNNEVRVTVNNGQPSFTYKLYRNQLGSWIYMSSHTVTKSSRNHTFYTSFSQSTNVRVEVVDAGSRSSGYYETTVIVFP